MKVSVAAPHQARLGSRATIRVFVVVVALECLIWCGRNLNVIWQSSLSDFTGSINIDCEYCSKSISVRLSYQSTVYVNNRHTDCSITTPTYSQLIEIVMIYVLTQYAPSMQQYDTWFRLVVDYPRTETGQNVHA